MSLRWRARRAWAFAALGTTALTGPAPSAAYYHFIHYLKTGNAVEKFDLRELPDKTVTFFVSENGPTIYSQTDSFNSVLSQVQQAAQVWNGVASSDLRVAFGGLEDVTTVQNTPGGDVIFEDLPPGVEGFGGPTSLANPTTAADGSKFFPIVRSVIHLSLNLQLPPGPSYGQSFLMTTIHEMGHALGLQHTFTSAAMSQATTSATTVSHPITADDAAGISVLYPNAKFAQFGSIRGKVSVGGAAIHLASVVALQSGADALSAVTNPDGSFRMDGVPPGKYAVYVHTMPPDADIYGPWNEDGSVAAASGAVNSVFYPGTTDFTQATTVSVAAGKVTGGINIQTVPRGAVPLYDGQVYAYFDNGAIGITPAPVTISTGITAVAASIVGLGSNEPVAGLSVQFPGGSVSTAGNGVAPFTANGYTYEAMYLNFSPAAQPGIQHIVFNTADYMYVLPAGMYLTQTGPPAVNGITSNGDGTVTVSGTNWSAGTLLYFDALPATILSLNPILGSAVVAPPPGANAQVSTVIAYNPDGQNSEFLQSASQITYAYGTPQATQITSITPNSLPAGAEAMVDITGSGFAFAPGNTTIGFGTSDVTVQRVFVLSPDHVQVDVYVAAKARLSNTDVSAISGFQLATAPAAFQITAAVNGLPAPYPVLFNGLLGLTGSYAGAIVSLYGANLSTPNATPSISIGGQPASVLYSSPSQINLRVPVSLAAGPAVLTLNNGIANAFPVTANIDTPPAQIAGVQNSSGAYIYSANAAHGGDSLIVTLTGFGSAGANINLSRVQVSVGGASHPATNINQVQVGSVTYSQITFQLNEQIPVGPAEPLIVYLDGQSSYPASIPITN